MNKDTNVKKGKEKGHNVMNNMRQNKIFCKRKRRYKILTSSRPGFFRFLDRGKGQIPTPYLTLPTLHNSKSILDMTVKLRE